MWFASCRRSAITVCRLGSACDPARAVEAYRQHLLNIEQPSLLEIKQTLQLFVQNHDAVVALTEEAREFRVEQVAILPNQQ